MINNSRTPVKGDLYRGLLFFGGTMKKIFSYIYIIMVCLCVCGCAKKEYYYEGKELVDRAAENHTALEGALVIVGDGTDNAFMQCIEYQFQGEVMTYMYAADIDGKQYYEYNNGTELNYITLPDETEWSFIAKGTEGYYTYSKASRHYFADGEQLFADYEAAVSGSEISETEYDTTVTLNYDLEKLKQYSAFAEYDGITDFSVTFDIDKSSGNCIKYDSKYTLSDGTEEWYIVIISERPTDGPVERAEIE